MQNGLKYMICKEGLIKFIVLVLGCLAFSLLAASNAFYTTQKEGVLAAYIISWSISLLLYFFRVTGLARGMDCGGGCSYDGFDFLWSWLSTINFLAASIVFAMNIGCDVSKNMEYCSLQAGSISVGFATFLAYAVEAFFLKSLAPANVGYIATLKGWFKTMILMGGVATFSLMVDSGYVWCIQRNCRTALEYSLVAFCLTWSVAVLLFFINMFFPQKIAEKQAFSRFEFGWSLLGALFFISGSSCFAAFMKCKDFENEPCQKRLGGVIIGFITSILFAIDAFINRPNK